DYLTEYAATELLSAIDASPWRADLSRRVQHYGYVYDYRRRTVDPSMYLGALPGPLAALAERLYNEGVFPGAPDQCIVNEYAPGQGIAPHVDCEPCFGDVVASLSLGSACVMGFSRVDAPSERVERVLAERSLLVMTGPGRYDWRHGIAARKSDVIDGVRMPRGRRVSVTFRTVILTAA
ncbi:MAG: alpha-ketoglutarate-dependent dioxygenase AlkB, partial [Chloroflexota bacterium]